MVRDPFILTHVNWKCFTPNLVIVLSCCGRYSLLFVNTNYEYISETDNEEERS